MMTMQEMYDTALKGIRAQGGPAANKDSGSCLYRAPDGRKCAMGFLIPDDKYGTWMEGHPAADMLETLGMEDEGVHEFVNNLQRAHDFAARKSVPEGPTGVKIRDGEEFFREFEPRMQNLARTYGLEYTPPEG